MIKNLSKHLVTSFSTLLPIWTCLTPASIFREKTQYISSIMGTFEKHLGILHIKSKKFDLVFLI